MEQRFFIGLDLGQRRDFTATAVVERLRLPTDVWDDRIGGPVMLPPTYNLRHLERPPLGTPYPAIVGQVQRLMETPPLRGRSTLVVDATGVGIAVTDLFEKAACKPICVSITNGARANGSQRQWTVPKRDLVGCLAVLFETQSLKIASGLLLAPALVQELANFKAKISLAGHESFEAWRESDHDDLVLAVALACWRAARPPFRRAVGTSIREEWN